MNEKTFFIILTIIFLLLLVIRLRMKKSSGLPDGRLIFEDLGCDGKQVKTLFSQKYGISGKPDMILKSGDELIPVEIKSTIGSDKPYLSHKLQLAAYCLLIEENYGIRPSRGILRYRSRQFEIPFTEELIKTLLSQTQRMRAEQPEKTLPPECGDQRRCRHCGFSDHCFRQDH